MYTYTGLRWTSRYCLWLLEKTCSRGVAWQSKLRGLNRLKLLNVLSKSLNYLFLLGFGTLSRSSCGGSDPSCGGSSPHNWIRNYTPDLQHDVNLHSHHWTTGDASILITHYHMKAWKRCRQTLSFYHYCLGSMYNYIRHLSLLRSTYTFWSHGDYTTLGDMIFDQVTSLSLNVVLWLGIVTGIGGKYRYDGPMDAAGCLGWLWPMQHNNTLTVIFRSQDRIP